MTRGSLGFISMLTNSQMAAIDSPMMASWLEGTETQCVKRRPLLNSLAQEVWR